MGCQCSNSNIDLNKEQSLNHENLLIKTKDIKILNSSNNNTTNDNIYDSNFSRESNKNNQNSNYLIYQLFEYLNKIRTNPMSIIDKIEKSKSRIFEKENKILFDCGNNVYSLLNKGITVFDDCIKFMLTQKILQPIELNNDLKIEFDLQNNSKKDFTSLHYITNILKKKLEFIKNQYFIIGFHYDVCSDNPEISSILQIVDDTGNHFSRRKNILNSKAKYVGISFVYINKHIVCYYLLFANNKN